MFRFCRRVLRDDVFFKDVFCAKKFRSKLSICVSGCLKFRQILAFAISTFLFVSLCSIASAAQSQNLLLLGDSLSAGYGLEPQQSWVHQVQQKLYQQNMGIEIINASISGATTAQGLAQLPALLKQTKPTWVVLELGANDGLQGKPLAQIRANQKRLIEQVQASGAQAILMAMQLPPNLGKRYTQPFAELYESLAKEYDLILVPFLLGGVAGEDSLMQSDGLHPNAEATDIIVANVWPVLSSLWQARGDISDGP